MKKGVELEFFVVDSDGNLCSAKKITGELDFAAPEFAECVVEIKSDPFESIEELKRDITRKTKKAIELGKEHDRSIVPLGTPLNHEELGLLETERLEMMKKFNPRDIEVEKELARIGFHIHFEKEEVKDQINVLTALDPAFALLNSSPYHQGRQVAASSRNMVYRYNWKPKFPESVSLWPYTDSVEEWKEKMHQAFDEFKKEAISKGISEKNFLEHYHPDRSIWTPIRLRDKFPTVEYRSPDTTLISEAMKLVEDIDEILEISKEKEIVVGGEPGVEDERIVLPEFEKVEELSKKAAENGIQDNEVREYLEKMGFDVSRYNPLSSRINGEENLTIQRAREKRLEASKMLEEDLESL